MATYGSLVVELGANVGRLQADMNRAVSVVDRSSASIRRAASVATTALAAIGGGIGIGISSIVGTIREFGKLQTSLVTVTGSAQAAQTAFAWLERFASTTPFQLDEVVGAFIKLDARGLKPTEAALRSFGNTASAFGRSLDQFVEAVADASSGEFERLKEFGIRAAQNGDQVAFTFRGLTTVVQKESAAITRYLEDIGNVEFAGATERQAATLDGAISNLSDSFAALARGIGEAGLTDALITTSRETADAINEITRAAREAAEALGLLGFAYGGAREAFAQVFGRFGIDDLNDKREQLDKLIKRLEYLRGEGIVGSIDKAFNALKGNDRAAEIAAVLEQINRLNQEIIDTQRDAERSVPRPATAPPAITGSGGGILDTRAVEKAAQEAKRAADALQRESDSVRAFLQDYAREREAAFAGEVEQSRRRMEAMREAIRTPREAAIAELAEFEQVFGSESTEYGRKAIEVFEQLEGQIDSVDSAAEKTRATFADLGATFSSAFEDAIFSGKKFSDVLVGLGQDIARLLLRQTVTDPLSNFFKSSFSAGTGGSGGGGFGDIFKSLFGGFRATGGPVSPGKAYVVGERGPELLIPGTAGTVMPNGAAAATVNVYNYGSDPVRTEQTARGIDVIVGGSVTRAAARGMLAPIGVRPPLVAR